MGDYKDKPNASAIVIYLDNAQHDCYIDDVIIWSGLVGVWSHNSANQLHGVHIWNLPTTNTSILGGIGILLEDGTGRVFNCYLDFAPLVIRNPRGAVVTNTYFLATAKLILQVGISKGCTALTVSNNNWNDQGKYRNDSIILDGRFNFVQDTIIENNVIMSQWEAKSTRATRTIVIPSNITQVELNFSNDLLFDHPIQEAFCSVQASEIVGHVIHPLVSKIVSVELSKAISSGKVTCSVDQSLRRHGAH